MGEIQLVEAKGLSRNFERLCQTIIISEDFLDKIVDKDVIGSEDLRSRDSQIWASDGELESEINRYILEKIGRILTAYEVDLIGNPKFRMLNTLDSYYREWNQGVPSFLHFRFEDIIRNKQLREILAGEGIEYVGELLNFDSEQLGNIRGIGRGSLREIKYVLEFYDLSLGMKFPKYKKLDSFSAQDIEEKNIPKIIEMADAFSEDYITDLGLRKDLEDRLLGLIPSEDSTSPNNPQEYLLEDLCKFSEYALREALGVKDFNDVNQRLVQRGLTLCGINPPEYYKIN